MQSICIHILLCFHLSKTDLEVNIQMPSAKRTSTGDELKASLGKNETVNRLELVVLPY